MSAVSTNVPSKKVMENSPGLKRLSHLFYILTEPIKGKIKLKHWRMDTTLNIPDNKNATNEQTLSADCGTIACAIGYACADPQFKSEGLGWNDEDGVPRYINTKGESTASFEAWVAVRKFFELDTFKAWVLFCPLDITEVRLHPGWTQRDIARKRLHTYLTDNGGQVSEFNRIDV